MTSDNEWRSVYYQKIKKKKKNHMEAMNDEKSKL